MSEINERLEYLRGELRAERISLGELAELADLAEHIEPGDVELLEAAGVPERGGCGSGSTAGSPRTSRVIPACPWRLRSGSAGRTRPLKGGRSSRSGARSYRPANSARDMSPPWRRSGPAVPTP